ncbi:hypothetical protein Tco_0944629 [Tanacetum coccineum]
MVGEVRIVGWSGGLLVMVCDDDGMWRGDSVGNGDGGGEVVAIVWGDGGVVGGDEVTCEVVVLKRKYLDECI